MEKPARETELFFTQPVRQIVIMLVITALVAVGGWFALPAVEGIFLANLYLNGFIGFVFVIGLLTCFWQVFQLVKSVSWIEDFVAQRPGHEMIVAPRLLAPLASLLRSRGARMQISSSSARSILDSVGTRIDEARDITRYTGNLLIFLGLLGTFYGLATTVPAVVDTIRSLAPQEGQSGVQVFDQLMTGLEAQLGGMGTAFSSSLLGLAGSLLVGLLELFAGHGQNRFFRELEEWLSTITRVGFSSGEAEGPGEGSAMVGVLDQMAEQMEELQALHLRNEEMRRETDARLTTLVGAIEGLAAQLQSQGRSEAEAETSLLTRIAEGQEALTAALTGENSAASVDAESRMRLRSIDVQLLRILEEITAGRQESTADLRHDLANLTAALRQATRGSTTRG